MLTRDLMTSDPHVLTGDESIRAAARMMRDLNVGVLPVVDDRAHLHLRGVLTDRDIAIRCVAEHSPLDCRVEDHMSMGHMHAVKPETRIAEVVDRMKRENVRRLMVTDNGRLVGVISEADLELVAGPHELE